MRVLFLNTNILLPQQHVVRGGGAGAALALGGDGGAPGRRHRSTGRKTHFGHCCRLQRNRQPSLPPKTESLNSQKRVRIGASLPIQPPLSLLRPHRNRLLVARRRQTRARSAVSATGTNDECYSTGSAQGTGWLGGICCDSPREREGQEKQLFEHMRTLRRPAPHKGSSHPSCHTPRCHQDLSL